MDGLINQSRAILAELTLPEFVIHPQYTFFYAVSDGKSRAHVFTVTGANFNSTWQVLVSNVYVKNNKKDIQYVDINM